MVIRFWNINRKNLSDTLIDLVDEQQIDILILAEATDKAIIDFLAKSKTVYKNRPFYHIDNSKKLNILSSLSPLIFKNLSSFF